MNAEHPPKYSWAWKSIWALSCTLVAMPDIAIAKKVHFVRPHVVTNLL